MFKLKHFSSLSRIVSINKNTITPKIALSQFQKAFRNDLKFDIRFPMNEKVSIDAALKEFEGKLVSEETFTDEYFDSNKFELTSGDIWLRKRNGKWECRAPWKEEDGKIHVGKTPQEHVPAYKYLKGEKEIRRELNIQQDATAAVQKTLEEDLTAKGIVSFAKFAVTVAKYSLPKVNGEVIISKADFGYEIGEVVVSVPNALPQDCKEVPEKLRQIAKALDAQLNVPNVKGIVEEYIKRNRPDHYKALLDKKIVHE